MKNSMHINIPPNEFKRVTMSRHRLKRTIKQVIDLMIELRDKCLLDEDEAIGIAINEIITGMDECAQLQKEGSYNGTKGGESLYCKYVY